MILHEPTRRDFLRVAAATTATILGPIRSLAAAVKPVRITDVDKGWVLVLPDPAEAITHLWAEGADADSAQALLDHWAGVAEQAGT